MKVGDLVRHRESGDCGIVVQDQEDDDGLYRVYWIWDSSYGFFDNEDIEVVNEGR